MTLHDLDITNETIDFLCDVYFISIYYFTEPCQETP